MNSALGKVVSAVMIDENDQDYFVQPDRNGQTYRLPKAESPQQLHIGGQVQGFVYENEDHQLQHLWPQPGDRLLMALRVDDKDRIWGQLADDQIYQTISNAPSKRAMNRDVMATVYRLKLNGTHVLTDDYQLGFIHPSERDQEPRLGQRVKARVIGLSSHGSLNLSLKPRAYQAIGEDAAMILTMLKHDLNQRLPYTDKTDPQVIRQVFGISKGQFKRAVGHLLKAGLVEETNGQLLLLKKEE